MTELNPKSNQRRVSLLGSALLLLHHCNLLNYRCNEAVVCCGVNRAVHVEEKGQPDCKRIDEREKLTSYVHELVIDNLGGLGDVVGQGLANAGRAAKSSGYEFENEKILIMKISIIIVSHELTHCILFPDTVFEDSKHLVSGYRVGKNAVRI